MFFIIEIFLGVLAATGLISIFIMLYDAESWLSKKFRKDQRTPADEILAEYQALENHKSGEDGAQDFNS